MKLDALRISIQKQRVKYHALPWFLRVLLLICAAVLFVFGAVLTPFLGDIGVPIMIVAMGVLGFQFVWAQRVFDWLLHWVEIFLAWFVRLSRAWQWGIGVATVVSIVVAVYFFYIHYGAR
jgi:hypothetical protein